MHFCAVGLFKKFLKKNAGAKRIGAPPATTPAPASVDLGCNANLISFEALSSWTNGFSDKIGEGGFGAVYKGTMSGGEEIAVKKLLRGDRRSVEEFTNEVQLISALQHRNLVRLLGCAAADSEWMLVYEFMPNGSLDRFIFGEEAKRAALRWEARQRIIVGVARGLLYLHRDSKPRIIHRDLKAANVLLDSEFNPKIADFGTARMFGERQVQALTIHLAGTLGYMSPEYAMEGKFSDKSDVFSFGVLVLEIVSGARSATAMEAAGAGDDGSSLNLLGQAWKLWRSGDAASLIDPAVRGGAGECDGGEVRRCVHVGLLCVQELPADRPTAAEVVRMLDGDSGELPEPKQAAFFARMAGAGGPPESANYMTCTAVEGR